MSAAHAQGQPDGAGPANAGAREREARALHEKGVRAYNAAQYDKAIEAFKEAYALSPVPGLLFNIAETYRLRGRGSCSEALEFYERYLDQTPSSARESAT